MHTGVMVPGGLPVQVSISGSRVQLSTASGAIWAGRTCDVRLVDHDTLDITSRGGSWSVRLDDATRFGWEFRPDRRMARRRGSVS